jgi:type II secretory pathway pseudopilin PulG
MKINLKKGTGLLEVVIAVAILTVSFTSIAFIFRKYVQYGLSNTERVKALYLAEEGIEAVKILRNSSWGNISGLSAGADYYVSFSTTTSSWAIGSAPAEIDGVFIRKVIVSGVNRDGNGDIAVAGTADSSSRFVNVQVEWPTITGTSTVELGTYITEIF